MQQIKMSDNLLTGIESIDRQLINIYDIVDKLHGHILENEGNEIIKETLNRLFKYLNFHFSYEVSVMESIGYPDIQSHKDEHDKCIMKIFYISSSCSSGNLSDPEFVTIYLVEWLTEHIAKFDMKLARYMHEHGHAE